MPLFADPLPSALPASYALNPAYPNPFNSTIRLSYALPAPGMVELSIFDPTGRSVKTFTHSVQPAGTYHMEWKPEAEVGLYAMIPSSCQPSVAHSVS